MQHVNFAAKKFNSRTEKSAVAKRYLKERIPGKQNLIKAS
jgi:hypothetical protein